MKRVLICLIVFIACNRGEAPETKPDAPIENNAAFSMSPIKDFYLVPNSHTTAFATMSLEIEAPPGTASLFAWAGPLPPVELTKAGNTFSGTIDLKDVPPGEHELVVSLDKDQIGVLKSAWTQSHPLYVVVSTDWDNSDNREHTFTFQEELHTEHPALLITHFLGPYTFTDPEVTEARKAEIVEWLVAMERNHQDEVGLHIHPYCNFVDSIGTVLQGDNVTCRHAPSTVYENDDSGYTVIMDEYTQAEQKAMFQASDRLFTRYGLSKPTSFRAGGWTAGLGTLKAMAETGYVADTSANNWARMEEWQNQENGVLYDWNQAQWSSINDTSQPYYPAQNNHLETGLNPIPVLEVPDNGILVDYVSTDEMIDVFEANWPGGALDSPKAYSIGYHPPNFGLQFKTQITNTLHHIDQFLAEDGNGPAVYSRLSDLVKVWSVDDL